MNGLEHPDLSPGLSVPSSPPATMTFHSRHIMPRLYPPFLLADTPVVYWAFRGKVLLGKISY